MEREKLGSRLGFILLSAGCAIGIGNVWKFPYMAGANGGGVFLLFYLLFLVILGLPVMSMEFAMGRAAQTSPSRLYSRLVPKKKAWHWHTPFMIAGNWLLMMFYTVVCGWMLRYFTDSLTGTFTGLTSAQITAHFSDMLADGASLVIYTFIVIIAGFFICAQGLQAGLEKVTKWMMGALLIIMIVLAIHSVLTPGAQEGLRYFLLPDWKAASEIGWINIIKGAMNQAFFTLSLGIGAMAIFGSYINKDHTLLSESVSVALLDTFVAMAAGLIIIPSCFAYDVPVGAGPSLIFITLPNIFAGMPLGQLWGSLFFLFLSFAAFTTVLAVFENIISMTMDTMKMDRKKACITDCLLMMILSLPCALGFNVLASITPMGEGTTIMDFEDFLVSNILLPLGSLLFVIFCTWNFGWGWNAYKKEANTGKGLRVPEWIHGYCKYVLPVIILIIFVLGIVS